MVPSEPKEERRVWPRWLAVAVVAFPFLGLGLLIFYPTVQPAGELARRAVCRENEKQILIAIIMYADDNGGRCPMDSSHPTLVGSMRLLSSVFPTARILYSPDDRRPGARPENDFKKLTTLNISYSYVPNLKWQDKADSPVVMDRIYSTAKGSRWPDNGNHGTNGGNVGFIDGRVQWCTTLPAALKGEDGKEVVLSP